jgi:hypothetical protein
VVEGARLESVYTGNRIAGSNPASSATTEFTWLKSTGALGLRAAVAVAFRDAEIGPRHVSEALF